MDAFNNFLLFLDGLLGSSPWFPYVLLGTGLFFTLYLGIPQIRFFGHAWKVLKGRKGEESAPGDTSHFQALSLALSGTVGTGNIGGVGLAIYIGGPAALFWMWMTAFFGMATKLTEVSLSHRYRVVAENGTMSGGPMYYMEKGLKLHWLAMLFAIATIFSSFGTGSLPQINNIALSLQSSLDVPPIATGAVMSVLLGLVIIGGIKRIKVVAATLVPTMAMLYFIGALSVILYNAENIIPSFLSVFQYAFTGSAAAGGFLGASFAFAFNRGVNRGLFSNEAGQGSAPIAHASARADEHVSEGMVSLLEPFIDTIIICTLTGLVILASGVWTEKFDNEFQQTDMVYLTGEYTDTAEADRASLYEYLNRGTGVTPYSGEISVVAGAAVSDGYTLIHARSVAEDVRYLENGEPYTGTLVVEGGNLVPGTVTVSGKSLIHSSALTTVAFTYGFFGDYGQYIVTFSLVLFAFSTAIAWSYYGDRAVIYLAGFRWVMPYRAVYCLGFFIASFTDTTIVWNFAAVTIVLMALPNLFGILLMRKEVKSMVDEYWQSRDAF